MPHEKNQLEFYATPDAFTRYLFTYMARRGTAIVGRILEPCVGDGAIIRAAALREKEFGVKNRWITNDIDQRWRADTWVDASKRSYWEAFKDPAVDIAPDWVVSNPPFEPAIDIIGGALDVAKVGVAMHLRASIHEVLKTGVRRTWMSEHLPTGILWLPRFAYQRSPSTGKWSTDSVCACWVVWLKPRPRPEPWSTAKDIEMMRSNQFIDYAPVDVLNNLERETAAYRRRMDELMTHGRG